MPARPSRTAFRSPLALSPFRFPGGKSRLVPLLRPWLAQPRLRVLVEPFAGGGSVSLAAVAEGLVDHAVLVELDDEVAAVWQAVLGEDARELAARVRAFRATEAQVHSSLARAPVDPCDRAFQTLLRNRVTRGGILHPGAGLLRRGEKERGLASRWYPDTLAERILRVAALRDRITFIHGDGLEVLDGHAGRPDVGAFLDPPYTVSATGPGGRLYRHAEVDHERLFALAAGMVGPVVLTYDDSDAVRRLVARYGFNVAPLAVRTTHHRMTGELLIGDDLRSVRRGLAVRHRDRLSCRDASARAGKMRAPMTPDSEAVHIDVAAARLGVSRRTLERLLRDGALVRADSTDGRTYVTAASLAAVGDDRVEPPRRASAAGELAAVLASMDKLLTALHEDRSALLYALRERDEARAEADQLRVELAAARTPRAA